MLRAVVVGSMLVLAGRAARACPAQLHVRDLSGTWQTTADAVRAELATRTDVDRCAEIDLAPAIGGARVTVWFDDGRRASRDIPNAHALRAAILVLVLVVVPVAHPLELHLPSAPDAPRIPPDVFEVRPTTRDGNETLELAMSGELGTTRTGGSSAGLALRAMRGSWHLGVAIHVSRTHETNQIGFSTHTIELAADVGYRARLGMVPITVFAGPRIAWLGQELDQAQPPSYVTDINPKTGASETHAIDDTRRAAVFRGGAGVRVELVAGPRFALGLVARAAGDVTNDVANHLAMTSVRTPDLATWSCELAFEGEVRLW